MDLADLVAGVFAFQGFAVVEVRRAAAGGPAGIIVRRGPLEIAIAVVPGGAPLDEARVAELLAELAGRPGARHLIAHAGAVTSAARAAAAAEGAVLWDRERLVAEAGAALVALADPDPFHPAGGDSPLVEAAQLEFDGAGRRGAGAGWPPAREGGELTGAGARRARRTLAPARGADGESLLGAMPPRAGEERARQIASAGRGSVIRSALEWVPAYLMDYHVVAELTTPRETQTVLSSGTLLISAAGGEAEAVEGPIEVVPPREVLDKAALSRALGRRRLTLLEARERTREEALARSERTLDSTSGGGRGATVTETHRQRPAGAAVDLLARGMLLLPYYLVETEKGIVTLNAATGRVVRVAPFDGDPGGRR